MNRRTLIGSLAVAAVAGPAFAQNQPAGSGMSGPAAPGATMGDAERRHIQDTMKTGSLSLLASRIAVQKAKNPELKRFAQFEVAEQETIAEVLKSMQGNMTMSAATGGAAPNGDAVAQLDDEGRQMMKKLDDAKAGAAFDGEYLKGQIDGHQKLLNIQETYIRSGQVREEVNAAKLARGQIKEHIARLQAMGDMRRG